MGKMATRIGLLTHGLPQLVWWRVLIAAGRTDTIHGWRWSLARWRASWARGEHVGIKEFIEIRPLPK